MVKHVINKYFILVIIALIFVSNLNSQVLYSEADSSVEKLGRILKINLTQLTTNEIDVSYEHFLINNTSLETGLGLVRPATYLQSINNNFYYSGYAINVEYKIYGKKGLIKDFYLASLFRYKYLYYNNEMVNHKYYEYGIHEVLETSNKQTYTLAAIIGARLDKKIVIDIYMGFGFRYYHEVAEEFENNDDYSLYYWRPNIEEISAFFPTAHFGIKFGYNTNK